MSSRLYILSSQHYHAHALRTPQLTPTFPPTIPTATTRPLHPEDPAHPTPRTPPAMEADLPNLIDDPRFRAYHRELAKPREFNTFDVLRYSGYEIRHSNVLAWLLRPADTHGIGSRFLKWFVDHVIGRFAAADRVRLPEASFEAGNVEVWRERDYVDVTILFKKEKCLIAVENKPESAHLDHLRQVMGYEETLLGKHRDHTVRSVLLSTSPDGTVNFPGIAHVGWDCVREAIGSVLADGGFPSPDVQAFIRQYLDMVERWFRPGSDSFRALLDDHSAILKELRRVLEKDGDGGVHAMTFMEKTPINRRKPDEYAVRDKGYGWEAVYTEEILSNEELVEMSAPEVEHEVIRRLEVFMDSDDSEYRRIDDYFQCLAFGSDDMATARGGSPLG